MAVVVAVAVVVALNPVWAAADRASLTGKILSEDARTPFSGAVVQLTGPSDEVLESEPTGADGAFTLSDLAPGVYRCLISTEDGYFQVTTALKLEPGQNRSIQLALKKEDQTIAAGVGTATGGGGGSGAASYAPLIGIGVVLLTVGIANAISDDSKPKTGSPSEPN
jgi:hypothetical protein